MIGALFAGVLAGVALGYALAASDSRRDYRRGYLAGTRDSQARQQERRAPAEVLELVECEAGPPPGTTP